MTPHKRPRLNLPSKLTDSSPCPIKGVHQGKKMEDVPASYLLWVADQSWARSVPGLLDYVDSNRESLEQEVVDSSREFFHEQMRQCAEDLGFE